ncbi:MULTISPECIES: hypothetical protein [unclassified Pseudoalteromonas]|uniref:hypothetical protein n=1 Tax=unclassified Pseudoalteromonas TaxID=194690 RepID=UPI002097998A|nr:hypothetical protein [Pseudoalteromonas sp. XMcav2-N]MCO7187186.1 hypothetical protein [Pseudoalteromonas sp. XMcav2-N]
MATDNSSPPEGVSQEDWTAYLNHKKEWAAMLRQRYDDELKNSPPIPPWEKYPEHEPGSLFWRMGIGEEYLTDYIGVYFEHSSQAEINAYKLKYPEPPDWAGWYKDQ